MKITRMVYIAAGCISMALGVLGMALPFLPTVPLFLLAAFCFGKSSKRLHDWFTGTKMYKDNLESYVKGQGMTWKAKIRIMITVTITMAVGFLMMSRVPAARIVLVCVWVAHVLFFCFGIQTKKSDDDLSDCVSEGR